MSKKAAAPEERRLPVVPPRRVSADDLKITVDGQDYYPRKGQWVEFLRGFSYGYYRAQRQLAHSGQDANASVDAWALVVEKLADCIWDWNWTDLDGVPLPRPYRNIAAFDTLMGDETMWLNSNVIPQANPQS